MRLVIFVSLIAITSRVHAQAVLPPIDDDECRECAAAPPPPPPPRQVAIVPTLGPGWHLELDPLAGTSYVRYKRTAMPGVWVPGLIALLGSWIGTTAGGVARDGNPWGALPFLGAFGSGIYYGIDGDSGRAIGYTLGGIGQVAGLVTLIVGLSGNKTVERVPVSVIPLSVRDGGGMGLSYKF